MEFFIPPHGGELISLVVDSERGEALKTESEHFLSLTLTQRQLCDLELLTNGAFSPLTGFMDQDTYDAVGKKREP